MPRQLLLPIAEEIKTELLVHEIVERVETRIRRAIANDLPHAMATCLPEATQQILGSGQSSLANVLRGEHCDQPEKRSELSGDDLKNVIDELRQFAETIDHRVKCLRFDIVQLAEFIHRLWEDDIDQADWWKRGGVDDESNEEDEVT